MKPFRFFDEEDRRVPSEAFENLMSMLHDIDNGIPTDEVINNEIKQFMYDCYMRNNMEPPLERDWGIVHIRGLQSRPDGMGGTELYGMVILTVIGRPSVYQNITISNDELIRFRL